MLSLDPERPSFRFSLAASSNPLTHRSQQGMPCDHHPSALHLHVCLSVITHVREENAAGLCDQQQARAAGEAAKISEVRKMADQESIETGRGKVLPKSLLACEEIHCCQVYQAKGEN